MHFRTKSSQPVLPAALRELVSMEMILPGQRERSHLTQAEHEKSLSTNRSINVENEATSCLRQTAVAGAHKEVLQRRWRFKEFALEHAPTSMHTLASRSGRKTQQEAPSCEGTLAAPMLGSPDSHPHPGGHPTSHLAHTRRSSKQDLLPAFFLDMKHQAALPAVLQPWQGAESREKCSLRIFRQQGSPG